MAEIQLSHRRCHHYGVALVSISGEEKNHQPDVQWQSDLKDTVYLKVSPKRARSYGKVFYLNAHVMVEIKYLNLPAIIKSQRRSEEKKPTHIVFTTLRVHSRSCLLT